MKKNCLYRIENNYRIYNETVSIEDVFYSELNIHFLDYLNNDTKIYYLQFLSNYDFSLDNDEKNYLSILDERDKEELNFVFSDNIKIIKCNQKIDLFFLTSLKNIDFLFLIPKLDNCDKYYFNLIIGVNYNFDVNQFFKWNLKTSCLKNINELTFLNLNENYLSQIINLLDNKFRNIALHSREGEVYIKHFTNGIDNIDSKLTKTGRIIYKKIIFKLICFHLYWYNNKVLKLNNTGFYIDSEYKDNIITKDENNGLKIISQLYDPSCFLNIISYSPEYICCIS